MSSSFDYNEAFSRSLGWLTELEMQLLRGKRVAIAGMGGVGGSHLLTLTRLGIGAFNIADMDVFEQANFNRQAGASLPALGRPKVDVMAALSREINPELDIRLFPSGVQPENLEDFLRGVDLYVDGLDFFCFDERAQVFAACHRLGIPAITAAPIGMGAALLNFLPGRMSFEDYFGFAGASETEKLVKFLVGLAPRAPHRAYLVDPDRTDLLARRTPSTPMACQLCAGVAATEALKILLRRGKVYAAPHGITYDAYLNRRVHTWRPGGYRNPLHRVLFYLGKRFVDGLAATAMAPVTAPHKSDTTMEKILDIARWAQSGDNDQPWRFEVRSEHEVLVHFAGSSKDDLYDYDGQPALITLGCLVESLRLAGTRYARRMQWRYQPENNAAHGGRLQVVFEEETSISEEPLCRFIKLRSVNRRRYRRQALLPSQKQTLAASLGDEFSLRWCEAAHERWALARLGALTCHLRLSIEETAALHQRIVDWDHDYSPDRVPARAIGISNLSLGILRWALADLRRVKLIGRLPGGTLSSQIESELIPGIWSAGYFMLVRDKGQRSSPEDLIRAGQAVQRFWLTATSLGLVLQPAVATLAFAYYGRNNIGFSQAPHALPAARRLAEKFEACCRAHATRGEQVFYLGRIGTPRSISPAPRSIRRPLAELIITAPSESRAMRSESPISTTD